MSPSNGQSGRTHTTDPSWIDYLADCGESCETVDKTKLKFFKIDGVGLVDGSEVPGTWGDDQLIKNNNSWMVEIPKSIAPGNYVLRHELMALHGAQTEGGAQDYPQCFNLKVTGGGSDKPEGTLGTELYKPKGDGIVVNIYSYLQLAFVLPGSWSDYVLRGYVYHADYLRCHLNRLCHRWFWLCVCINICCGQEECCRGHHVHRPRASPWSWKLQQHAYRFLDPSGQRHSLNSDPDELARFL